MAVTSAMTPARTRARTPAAERSLDLALAIVLLPVIVLVGAAIALAIFIDSPGAVIYRSLRVGRDGELFEMLKFRKMRREAHSHPLTLDDDEPSGARVLRQRVRG